MSVNVILSPKVVVARPFFETVPKVLKIYILSLCTADVLLKLAQSCKEFNSLITETDYGIWKKYAQRKGIHFTVKEDESAKQHVFRYVKIFARLFPEINTPTESLEERLDAISTFAHAQPGKLLEKIKYSSKNDELTTLQETIPPSLKAIIGFTEAGRPYHWKMYIKNGFPFSTVDMLAIFDVTFTSLQPHLKEDYFVHELIKEIRSVRGSDFKFPDEAIQRALEKKYINTALLMISRKDQAEPALFQRILATCSSDDLIEVCVHFYNLGYQFSREDLRVILKNKLSFDLLEKTFRKSDEQQPEKLFEKFLQSVVFAANRGDIEWAVNPDSYQSSYEHQYLCPIVLQKMVDLSSDMPSTQLFQQCVSCYFSPNIVDIFLRKGYQITSADFRFVVDQLVEKPKVSKLPWKISTSDLDYQVLSQILYPEEEIKRKYPTNSTAYMPTQSDFQYVLKKQDISTSVIEEIIKRGYVVTSEDFKCALENKCSEEIVKSLLHKGCYQEENDGTEMNLLGYDNQGFEPTWEELNYARNIGCSKNILNLIIERNPKVVNQ